ncbi:hypothetical protein [Saccharopolyspora hordei]|uniref:Uncharacterized protein n=1 Tax=Saccharopolyspora hordei TaxID=1838 RepID=A0A853AKY7_9PSEU|nr:hypothetical protein [Saccharopolyspora hordei]NYI85374.1 hypothetical protein [Saccharopolyspora hordei]
MLGEYLGRSHTELKRRPHHLVEELSPESAVCRLRPAELVS